MAGFLPRRERWGSLNALAISDAVLFWKSCQLSSFSYQLKTAVA